MIDREAEKRISATKEECLAFGKPSIEDMLDAVRHSAHHFECTELRRMLADWALHPDMTVMQHVVNLDSLGTFLEAVIQRPHEVARRLTSKGRS